MSKKIAIGVGVGAGVIVAGLVIAGFGLGWFNKDKPVSGMGGNNEISEEKNIENEEVNNENTNGTVPNIINRSGTIHEIDGKEIVISISDDEKVTINVKRSTKIYAADGTEKELKDLKEGMYITVDIDGDLRDENDKDDEFDADVIYISGK